MGPRQVGKTTLSLHIKDSLSSDFFYLNWDNLDDREIILHGPKAIANLLNLDRPRKNPPLLVFDEIHKYHDWKNLLKGFFDTYSHAGEVRIIVTGSARLDIFNFGGDSLMGRYFRYRIHPFSVAELLQEQIIENEIHLPSQPDEEMFEKLFSFGGFPEPFIKGDRSFYENWKQLRLQQLFYEEVRDITRIHQIQQMELLAIHLKEQAGGVVNYTNLSNKIRISSETVRRWISTLNQLYYCFTIQPWSKNVTRSLLKEPKVYLWDWSLIAEAGAKAENFIASHLLKACHYWMDRGMGKYELFYLRDKEKREVDFLVTKNDEPWFLVEVKSSETSLSSSLGYFQKQIQAKHAFQVVLNAPFEEINCFDYTKPVIVSAKTFLSQLV
jgi:predicted AAA+ superfamily ATPase